MMIYLQWLKLAYLAPFLAAFLSLNAVTIQAAEPKKPQPKGDVIYKWVGPMHPQIVRDKPGFCPICGMALVKKAFHITKTPTISASSSRVEGIKQTFAIRTTKVQKTTLWKYIPTFGRIKPDQNQLIHIHPRASGWMSDLALRDNGDAIEKGQLLYRLYSPEIVAAQQDYILALKNQKRMGKAGASIVKSAQVRLELLGLANSTLKQIKRSLKLIYKVPVYAPQSGVAENLKVQNGMYIQPKMELMSLTNLSQLWVEADVLPRQQHWVKNHLTVEISSDALPGNTSESQISYIYPNLDPKTHSLRVRIPLSNPFGLFHPNQLVNVAIYGGPKHNVLAIPQEAIIDDGEQKRVVKQLKNGQFKVAKITTGMHTQGIVEVKSGLKPGETIVTSGEFLIDSESQIQTNLQHLISQ